MLTFSPSQSLITTAHKNPFPQFSTKTQKFNHSFPLLGTKLRNGFALFSLKSGKKGALKPETSFEGFDNIDDEEGVFDDYEDIDDENNDDDEEGEFVPLKNMKKWLVEKPSGFGDGKEYDTSVEDKLLDEMQQSRDAQLININKLKNTSQRTNSSNRVGLQASEVVPTGIRVRLSNLPKKKNIDRDLKRAFKGIPGIINMSPAVSGNVKTRDPTCKGFAFVDLKSEDYAHRFAKVVSGQFISFGKMEKQIKCEVMKSKPQKPALEQSVGTDSGANNSSSHSISSNYPQDTNDKAGPIKPVVLPETRGKVNKVGDKKLVTTNGSDLKSSKPPPKVVTTNGSGLKSSKPPPKVVAKEKKLEGKQLKPKVTKLNVPGSANRLRVREKAMLTGVLSKYAVASSVLQEQR